VKEAISRRTFAKLLGVGAAGALIRPGAAQETPKPATAAMLDERAKQLYDAAIRGNLATAQGRLRYKLIENSEPCAVFHVQEPKK
jgi:hypothetical protein